MWQWEKQDYPFRYSLKYYRVRLGIYVLWQNLAFRNPPMISLKAEKAKRRKVGLLIRLAIRHNLATVPRQPWRVPENINIHPLMQYHNEAGDYRYFPPTHWKHDAQCSSEHHRMRKFLGDTPFCSSNCMKLVKAETIVSAPQPTRNTVILLESFNRVSKISMETLLRIYFLMSTGAEASRRCFETRQDSANLCLLNRF